VTQADHLTVSVGAGVGAPGGGQLHLPGADPLERRTQLALDGAQPRLALPAVEVTRRRTRG
jgi:hypothetical protein